MVDVVALGRRWAAGQLLFQRSLRATPSAPC